MRLRRFFNPEPRENLGSGSGSLKFLLGGFRLITSFFSESLISLINFTTHAI
jgi:hypothetical protein